jgi:hypothetical protein
LLSVLALPLSPSDGLAMHRSVELDWTRRFAVVNRGLAVEPFVNTDRLTDTECATLMSGACATAYGSPPRKAQYAAGIAGNGHFRSIQRR